ncbi:flagellar protein fliO [Legionella birminghamensis]|uniref:Flagellar protein n=1 Tax=Legionella birminghamensis TaxID=28083 RepID=A0A378I966_9GAMM|nr:flagellar biosynthetic protein FliO [Legionella birminghamensis]KTC68011.1 flagellar protein fliO [Legionella birminghamensis]STX31280.1 flagellar assembly protein FliO [Legionella birminghamensis]
MKLLGKGLALFFFLATAAHAAGSGEPGLSNAELLRILIGLLFVIVLILAFTWLLKQLNRMGNYKNANLEVISSSPLGPRERILVLRAGARYLLLGVTSNNISILCDFGEQLPSGFEKQKEAGFADLLKNALRTKS